MRSSDFSITTSQPLASSTRSPPHLVAAAVCTLQEPETSAEFYLADPTTKLWQAGHTPEEFIDRQAGCQSSPPEHVSRIMASNCPCPRHASLAFSALCEPCPPSGGATNASANETGHDDSIKFESSSVGAPPRFVREKYADMDRDLKDVESHLFGDVPRFKTAAEERDWRLALMARLDSMLSENDAIF